MPKFINKIEQLNRYIRIFGSDFEIRNEQCDSLLVNFRVEQNLSTSKMNLAKRFTQNFKVLF